MHWEGEFVLLPAVRTPKHLASPGNAAQHWVASSERIRKELGYREPVGLEQAITRTTAWEKVNPPTGATFFQFDYEAEDAALREPQNTFQNVYHADHTWWGARLGKPPDVRGWWRIEGDELIRGIQQGRKPRTDRLRIRVLDKHRLVVQKDGEKGRWLRVAPKR